MSRSVLTAFAALLSAFLLAACSGGAPAPGPQPIAPVATNGQAEFVERIEYRLGSGDQLRVIVFGEEDLSGEFVVDGSGRVSLPLIGEVQAQNLTLREFEGEVRGALADGYLNDPRVSAEVLNYRPFYILGEVEEPGTYPYTNGLTVVNAVATAGGFTYRANTRTVFIKRDGTNVEIQVELSPNTAVQPGDTIRIAERFF